MTTYEDAEDQYVDVGGVKFAYRHFGATAGVPLVLLMHFRGTMDHWYPALINPIAAVRPVFIMDNAGIGRSEGQVANSFADWAQYTINVLSALLIANGRNDLLLPSDNSYLMWKRLVNAEPHLHLFPDSGHGFLYQYADQFSRMINGSLDAPPSRKSRL